MKPIAIILLFAASVISVRAAEVEMDCRDYDGGFHAEAMRLNMLESDEALRDQATPVTRDDSPVPASTGDRMSNTDPASGKEK